MGDIEKLDGQMFIGGFNSGSDIFRHDSRTIPHSVINDRDLVFLVIRRPLQVFFDYLRRVLPPDDPVTGADDIDRQPQSHDFPDFFLNQLAERGKNVGVIFDTLGKQFLLIDQVVE